MKLIPEDIKMPEIGSEASMCSVKLFTPWGSWTWYISEYDPETGDCFGVVDGFAKEVGYFNLNELKEISGPAGLKIERDLCWEPKKLRKIMGWDNG